MFSERLLLGGLAVALPVAAQAGDQVVYEAAPTWVDDAVLDSSFEAGKSPILLLEQQARIEDGQLWTFIDTAVALDTPQALTQFGTLSANWLPDKGDLIVHSAQIVRNGEVIDLLETGSKFEVIRREQGLESRLIDGSLTATMNVVGARVGDIVRLSYSVTLSDQAMGDNVQWQSPLLSKPFPLRDGRISVSWPEDLPVSRVRLGDTPLAEPSIVDGYFTWVADLPREEADPVPADAPLRYQLGELVQVSTYTSWVDVSRQMARHYTVEGLIDPAGDLAEAIRQIAEQTDDPLQRAARAIQTVQDDVSYLANGLNGGNYLPQAPEETWANRYGDCKAKSVLLLAMLQELGITAEVVLVRTQGGDALPMLAPMPGNFDHVIVRAEIGGKNYWLDGTNLGTRLANIDVVPRFFFALPLREMGADLLALDVRAQNSPDETIAVVVDHSAGIRVPALLDVKIKYHGASGAQWRAVAEQMDEDTRGNAAESTIKKVLGDAFTLDEDVSYDPETGTATVSARAMQTTMWEPDRAIFRLEPPAQAAKEVEFAADRARPSWRDIPLRLNGPIFLASETRVLLPENGEGFGLEGEKELQDTIGGVQLSSLAGLEGGSLTLSQSMRSVDAELPADGIAPARRALARFDRSLPVLSSPSELRNRWEYFGKDRDLLKAHEAFYAQAIKEAEPDDPNALTNRARFLAGIYDHEAALKDLDATIDVQPSHAVYLLRGFARRQVGDLEGALEDYRLAEDLQPDGSTLFEQVEILSLLGLHDAALSVAGDFGQLVDDPVSETNLVATAMGWAGSHDDGLGMLEDLKSRRPGDGALLNLICWYAGIWNQMNPGYLQTCTEAVEKSDYSVAALDSRALAHFRMGNLSLAKADIDAVLLGEPGLAEARLLRGIILVAQGDDAGREEIALALAMKPMLRATYEGYGLEF